MYYYQYKVTFKTYRDKIKTKIIRADNPAHLTKRLQKLHPRAEIIKYTPI